MGLIFRGGKDEQNNLSADNPTTDLTTLSSSSESSYQAKLKFPFTVRCTSEEDPSPFSTTNDAATFLIEKRRRSEIVRERKPELAKKDPPNLEVGWKRTKEIVTEKPKGYVIMDFLEKLAELMGRDFGSPEQLAKAGEIVVERAREEAEVLRDWGEVEERMVTELFRVLRLMEMDLAMVRAAMKEEKERIEQARARCRQAILIANSF